MCTAKKITWLCVLWKNRRMMRIIIVKEIKNEKYHHQRYCQMKMKKQKKRSWDHTLRTSHICFHGGKHFSFAKKLSWGPVGPLWRQNETKNVSLFVLFCIPTRIVTGYQILGGLRGKKSLICLEGKLTTPQEKHYSFTIPPSYWKCLIHVSLTDFLSWHGALQVPSTSPCMFLLELWIYKDTMKAAMLGVEVLGHGQELQSCVQVIAVIVVNAHLRCRAAGRPA